MEMDDAGFSKSSELDFILKAQGNHKESLRFFRGGKSPTMD